VSQKPDLTEELFLEAAAWWRRAQSGNPDEIAALEVWLEADSAHQEAFAYIRSTWESFDETPTSPDMLRFRASVLNKAEMGWRRRMTPVSTTRRVVIGSAAAAVAAAVAIPVTLWFGNHRRQTITTGIGEQHVAQLDDGTRVTLDANSRVNVNFNRNVRNVTVEAGRAYFDVAKDPGRPFIVRAMDYTVTAVGTAFTVEVRKKKVAVTLFEGRIDVAKRDEVSRQAAVLKEVTPSQQVVMREDIQAPPQYRAVNEREELAWRDSELFFNEEPLSEVVDRMNDYSPTKISVEGNVGQIKVSGMYIAGQTDAFVDALEKFYPVKAGVSQNRVVISPAS
jgi:transmembrane sensor